mmetsp:Transcript_4857/g.13548  ORF Transcript_4857/g.13548 Transcript_4857/m.13548 type:complete len:90 (+) Transcript_4857:350-619(+)
MLRRLLEEGTKWRTPSEEQVMMVAPLGPATNCLAACDSCWTNMWGPLRQRDARQRLNDKRLSGKGGPPKQRGERGEAEEGGAVIVNALS